MYNKFPNTFGHFMNLLKLARYFINYRIALIASHIKTPPPPSHRIIKREPWIFLGFSSLSYCFVSTHSGNSNPSILSIDLSIRKFNGCVLLSKQPCFSYTRRTHHFKRGRSQIGTHFFEKLIFCSRWRKNGERWAKGVRKYSFKKYYAFSSHNVGVNVSPYTHSLVGK